MDKLMYFFAKIMFNYADSFELMALCKLNYIEASGNYSNYHFTGSQIKLVTSNLKHCCETLQFEYLYRVCNSFAINVLNVACYDKSSFTITFRDGSTLVIPEGHNTSFKKFMQSKFPCNGCDNSH